MIVNLGMVRAKHKLFKAGHKSMTTRILNSQRGPLRSHVSTKAGFLHITLTTLNSTKARVIKTASGAIFRASNNTKRAYWLEHGTRPHVIEAKRVDFLHFYWHKLGGMYSFRKVNHPGIRATNFLRNATRHVYLNVHALLRAGMVRQAQRF